MKRLIVILFTLCLTAWCASAQYARPSVLNVRAGKVFADGVKMTEGEAFNLFADLNGYNRSFDYQNYRNGYKTGAGLMIGGAGAFVLGWCTFYGGVMSVLLNGVTGAAPMIMAGSILFYGGAGCMIAGIPVLCVYNSRIKDLAHAYNYSNSRSDVSLNFGATNNGVGFALNF